MGNVRRVRQGIGVFFPCLHLSALKKEMGWETWTLPWVWLLLVDTSMGIEWDRNVPWRGSISHRKGLE